ncbi:MAG: cytochrome c oxidase subunit 3 [Gammaproteobacteria bacterium]|nr:cytochrome c oxidase subunit 3 [Gammaproteobacteria bacterium]MDG1951780.1 cytochrome c oxidase subunit 3 [Gammaproteobacteria bacterium]|tara:strand:- start:1408 stop:2019 length:612 start_codon:yes stop_codon:yes gene_type:complete
MSLFKQITDKPWERTGIIGGLRAEGTFSAPPEKVALVFFLVAASIVFSLFGVSYVIRMELPDWVPVSEPSQLWFNTALLVVSSFLFQRSKAVVSAGKKSVKSTFAAGGIFAILFIAAQMVTWQNLQAQGLFMTSNPANSFYYLLTGLHALHILGGLWVWSKSLLRLLSGAKPEELRLSIELCTVYWHFLLIVWIAVFAVLSNT